MEEVIINGVRYVPVSEASPDMEAITRGLLMSYWGIVSGSLAEAKSNVHVYVNDNATGQPIDLVLADIASAIREKGK
jgi:hypothetical protein